MRCHNPVDMRSMVDAKHGTNRVDQVECASSKTVVSQLHNIKEGL